jgi:hypothetical protein
MKQELFVYLVIITIPFVVFFSVKFGTIAYYKAKEYMEREKACCDSPNECKCHHINNQD